MSRSSIAERDKSDWNKFAFQLMPSINRHDGMCDNILDDDTVKIAPYGYF